MRYFNTSGPCDPATHYTIMREELIATGKKMVEQGKYFSIFAPRQSGKTTYFHLLLARLREENRYAPMWISFEDLHWASNEEFYEEMGIQLGEELSKLGHTASPQIFGRADLTKFFREIREHVPPIILFIDEFEGIPESVLNEMMHLFRKFYHRKETHGLHSLILVGVSTIADLVLSSASPFNIVDELQIPYFTHDEVNTLIQQYISESGQAFEESVIEAIYDNTHGQPGLVNALCAYLTEKAVPSSDTTITMEEFYRTLNYFLTRKFDKNLENVIQKARQKTSILFKLLFRDEPIPFSVHDADLAWLFAHGVIDEVNGLVEMTVPLYAKVLITAFRPLLNGESDYYLSAHETLEPYVSPEGLNLNRMLDKYRQYVRQRGFKAFDTEHLKEGAWHYSLDGFLNFFIEQLGGHTLIETPTSRGRTDILILYQHYKYVIETKIFTTEHYFQKGKRQLATYLESEGLNEGYYVVFSDKHSEQDVLYCEEEVKGKHLSIYIIRTNFERATQQ